MVLIRTVEAIDDGLGSPELRACRWPAQIEALKAAGCERVYSERASPGADSRSLPRARARRVRFGPPDRLSPLGEVYLQPTLTTGHWTGEGGAGRDGGEDGLGTRQV